MNRKNRTVILRLSAVRKLTGLTLLAVPLLLTGCATTYSVKSLPKQYAAKSTSDFSSLNLTAYARPAPDSDQIRSGDRLKLSLNSGTGGPDASEDWTVGVDAEGNATLPNIGPVRLVGLTRSQAEQAIVNESISRDVYLTPAVGISVAERHENSIMVTGGVATPGELLFPEATLTLADVIVRAGGLTSTANGKVIVNRTVSSQHVGDQLTTVSHSTEREDSTSVDLATTSAASLASIEIPTGATVTFEESGPRSIRVIGVINDRELQVPAGRNIRLLDALALAGGPQYSHWVSNRVDVIRRVPGRNETVRIRASIRNAKKDDEANLLLAPDDIVSVEENPMTFTLSTLGGLTGVSGIARNTFVP